MEDSKKPSLDKVLKRLEELDIQAWERKDNNGGPRFIANVNGLTVYLFIDYIDLGTHYYGLTITNRDGNKNIIYKNYGKKSAERKGLENLYQTILKKFDEIQEKEFEEMIKNFLSD